MQKLGLPLGGRLNRAHRIVGRTQLLEDRMKSCAPRPLACQTNSKMLEFVPDPHGDMTILVARGGNAFFLKTGVPEQLFKDCIHLERKAIPQQIYEKPPY